MWTFMSFPTRDRQTALMFHPVRRCLESVHGEAMPLSMVASRRLLSAETRV